MVQWSPARPYFSAPSLFGLWAFNFITVFHSPSWWWPSWLCSRRKIVSHRSKDMSPALAQAGAGSAAKDVKRESAIARLLGSGKDNGHRS
jgi:hypothetical protein